MEILKKILDNKRKEVDSRKELFPIKLLESSIYFGSKPLSLKKYIQREDKVGIIAEFKRKSPSRGDINRHVSVEKVSIGYMQSGASGLSILTDTTFFGGSSEDLTVARNYNYCPILRKDFIIDEYQIIEAKSIGADVILLIAAALSPAQIKQLSQQAKSLGMEVLLEVHSEEELEKSVNENVTLVGVNNRNLKTFETDINISKRLSDKIPNGFVKVSESGINRPEIVIDLMKSGFEGFLVGEQFMKSGRPEKSCESFIKGVKELIEK